MCAPAWTAAQTPITPPTILWKEICWSKGKMAAKGVDRIKVWHFRRTRMRISIQLKFRSIPPMLAATEKKHVCMSSKESAKVKCIYFITSKWLNWISSYKTVFGISTIISRSPLSILVFRMSPQDWHEKRSDSGFRKLQIISLHVKFHVRKAQTTAGSIEYVLP